MVNLKYETLSAISRSKGSVVWAVINKGDNEYILRPCYTKEEYREWLESLDFEYDDANGFQEIYGKIGLDNMKWLERKEYDGSEYWEICQIPQFPQQYL